MNADRGSVEAVIIDAEVIERGWTSPDWLSPAVWRFGWLVVRVVVLVGLALALAWSLDHEPETPNTRTPVRIVPCLSACDQIRIDVRKDAGLVPVDETVPSDAPTTGLVKVDDDKVSARCWLDLIDAGFVGRTDNTEHRIYADPDAIELLCDQTQADRKFADKWDDERNGSGTYGPTADVDTPLTR